MLTTSYATSSTCLLIVSSALKANLREPLSYEAFNIGIVKGSFQVGKVYPRVHLMALVLNSTD